MTVGRATGWGALVFCGWACSSTDRSLLPGDAATAAAGADAAIDIGTTPEGGGAHGDPPVTSAAIDLDGRCEAALPAPGPIVGTAGTLPAPGPYRPCVVLGGPTIVALRISSDGRRAAALGAGGQVLILDAETLRPIATLARARGAYTSLAISRDGTLVAAGAQRDGELDVWRAGDHALLLAADLGAAWSLGGGPIAFSSDGALVAASAGPETAIVDVRTGTARRLDGGRGAAASALAFVDGDRRLASVRHGYWAEGATGGSVALVDLATGAVTTLLSNDDIYGPAQLEVAGDGRTLLTSRFDGWTIWDAATGATLATVPRPNAQSFTIFGLSADGAELGALLGDRSDPPGQGWFQRRRASDGAVIAEVPLALGNATTPQLWSPARETFYAQVTAPAGERQIVSVDLAGARVTARTCAATPPVQSVAFSQDGTRLLASTGDLRLTQFDAASGAALGPLPDGIGPYYEGLTLSPDGRHAGWTQLVPTGPNMWLDTLNLSEMPGGATQTLLRGQPGALVSPQPVFSPDSRLFASVDFFSDLLDVFDVETAALLSEVPLGWAYPTPLGFTADGSAIRLADETSVRTVNWRDGTTLSAWTAGARPSAASADGATVVMDGGSVLRSYREGVLLAEMPTTDDNIYCAETPITRMAPGASVTSFGMQCGRPWDSTTGPLTQIRDTATGALIQSLAIDPSIVFSWDGRRFAAGDTVWCQ